MIRAEMRLFDIFPIVMRDNFTQSIVPNITYLQSTHLADDLQDQFDTVL